MENGLEPQAQARAKNRTNSGDGPSPIRRFQLLPRFGMLYLRGSKGVQSRARCLLEA